MTGNSHTTEPFLKRRAVSLHRSGYKTCEIARMLNISWDAAYYWISPQRRERKYMCTVIARAEKAAAVREHISSLPTLPFVPGICVTGRYVMRAP